MDDALIEFAELLEFRENSFRNNILMSNRVINIALCYCYRFQFNVFFSIIFSPDSASKEAKTLRKQRPVIALVMVIQKNQK